LTKKEVVAIIVLNWRKPAETLICLESLAGINYPHRQVIVVDNGSGDDSVSLIRQGFPDAVVLETNANLGYAGGNNVGIHYALAHDADAVLILNNDITVDPNFLEPLLDAALSGPEPAVVTSAVCEMARQDVVWALGADINWHSGSAIRLHCGELYAAWRGAQPYQVGYAAGSVMLAPRRVWEVAGLIDETYFLYFEDADWCIQAQRAGFKVLAVPNSVVWHEVDAQQNRGSPTVTYYMTRNALRFISRNLPIHQRIIPMLRVILQAHWFMLGDLKNGQMARAMARLQGIRDYAFGRFGPRLSKSSQRQTTKG